LTFSEAVEEIARATGRPTRFVSLSRDEFRTSFADQNLPAEFVSLIDYLFTEVLDGRNAHLTDGVQRAIGRPPRDFTDYVMNAAATGVWDGVGHTQSHAESGVSR